MSLIQQQWIQATLPIAVGGLGLRAASDHCFAAYITSLLSSQDLKQQILDKSEEECPPTITAEMLERLQATTGREDSIRSLQGLTQKEMSLSIDMKNLHDFSTSISDSGNIRHKARLGSLGLPNSGSWLNVIPSPTLGLHLHCSLQSLLLQ